MALTTRTLTVNAQSPDAAKLNRLLVEAELTNAEFTTEGLVVPSIVKAWTDSEGVATLELFPNELGTQSSKYTFRAVRFVDSQREVLWTDTAEMPDGDTNLDQIIGTSPNDQTFASGAAISAALATTKADEAADSASSASDSADTASTAAESIGTSVADAVAAALAASDSADAAAESATAASDSADAASASAVGLSDAVDAAAASALAASDSEDVASTGARSASTYKMRWNELDAANLAWNIPDEQMNR
jgi:hypothetical protein